MDMVDRVALVTGGTMGLGAAMAVELARRGTHVALVARNLGPPAAEVAATITAMGRRCELIQADMSLAADCRRCVAVTESVFGRLDVLIPNAGGPSPGTVPDIGDEQWLQTMAVHVNALFFLATAAVPLIRRQGGGAIVTVSSVAGLRGVPGALAYATAKGAVIQFTRCLARDLASDRIRVNCVAPGVIRTRFHDDMTPERKRINLEQRIPLGTEGTPQQVAEAVLLLVTNDYITGETVVVDGGLSMRVA
jgi:NAD(P)-dependent dehydrogenase (short-subunit alcohol dehydrogenase family)